MLIEKEPYFMKNKEWYYYVVKIGRYQLTDKAPKKAVESFKEFYRKLDYQKSKHILKK